jgi:hypothetical protein
MRKLRQRTYGEFYASQAKPSRGGDYYGKPGKPYGRNNSAAPIFDNGLSLFCCAMKDDYAAFAGRTALKNG